MGQRRNLNGIKKSAWHRITMAPNHHHEKVLRRKHDQKRGLAPNHYWHRGTVEKSATKKVPGTLEVLALDLIKPTRNTQSISRPIAKCLRGEDCRPRQMTTSDQLLTLLRNTKTFLYVGFQNTEYGLVSLY